MITKKEKEKKEPKRERVAFRLSPGLYVPAPCPGPGHVIQGSWEF